VSLSPGSTKSVEVPRQAYTASKGAGRATAGKGVKQGLSSGRKATEETVGTTSKAVTVDCGNNADGDTKRSVEAKPESSLVVQQRRGQLTLAPLAKMNS